MKSFYKKSFISPDGWVDVATKVPKIIPKIREFQENITCEISHNIIDWVFSQQNKCKMQTIHLMLSEYTQSIILRTKFSAVANSQSIKQWQLPHTYKEILNRYLIWVLLTASNEIRVFATVVCVICGTYLSMSCLHPMISVVLLTEMHGNRND